MGDAILRTGSSPVNEFALLGEACNTLRLTGNQVEIWFNRITQQTIRRGTFRSVKELVEKIDDYVQNSNRRAKPFVWTATADSIFAKIERLCERISGTAH